MLPIGGEKQLHAQAAKLPRYSPPLTTSPPPLHTTQSDLFHACACACPTHPPPPAHPHTRCLPQVRCLNEQVSGSGRNVLKPWHQRLQPTAEPLRSNEDDTELLLHIP